MAWEVRTSIAISRSPITGGLGPASRWVGVVLNREAVAIQSSQSVRTEYKSSRLNSEYSSGRVQKNFAKETEEVAQPPIYTFGSLAQPHHMFPSAQPLSYLGTATRQSDGSAQQSGAPLPFDQFPCHSTRPSFRSIPLITPSSSNQWWCLLQEHSAVPMK